MYNFLDQLGGLQFPQFQPQGPMMGQMEFIDEDPANPIEPKPYGQGWGAKLFGFGQQKPAATTIPGKGYTPPPGKIIGLQPKNPFSARLFGGPVYPGQQYTYNEDGNQETLVNQDGSVQPLSGGPGAMTPTQPGNVVPSPETMQKIRGLLGTPGNPSAGQIEAPSNPGPSDQYTTPYSEPDKVPRATPEQMDQRTLGYMVSSPKSNVDLMGKQPSVWKRIGSGLMARGQMWAQQGGPGGGLGLIGALVRGGAGSAISPEEEAGYRKDKAMSKLWSRYGQEYAMQQAQAQQQQANFKALQEKTKLRNEIASPYLGGVKEMGAATPQNVADLEQMGIPYFSYNANPLTEETRNGDTYLGRMKGPGAGLFAKSGTLPTQMSQKPYMTTAPDGVTKVPLTGDQLYSHQLGQMEAGTKVDQFNATQAGSADKTNAELRFKSAEGELGLQKNALDAAKAAGINTSEAEAIFGQAQGAYETAAAADKNAQMAENRLANLPDNDPKYDTAQREARQAREDAAKAWAAYTVTKKTYDAKSAEIPQLNSYATSVQGLKAPKAPTVQAHTINNPFNRNPKNDNVTTTGKYLETIKKIRNK